MINAHPYLFAILLAFGCSLGLATLYVSLLDDRDYPSARTIRRKHKRNRADLSRALRRSS